MPDQEGKYSSGKPLPGWVTEYEFHPESKCADGSANPRAKTNDRVAAKAAHQDRPHPMHRQGVEQFGNVDEGMAQSEQNVYTEYADPKRSEWVTKIQPALKKPKLRVLVKACGKRLSRRKIIELRAGRKKPHRKTPKIVQTGAVSSQGGRSSIFFHRNICFTLRPL